MEFSLIELMQKPIWVQWKYSERKGKITKIPINAMTCKNAKADDPSTWSTYGTCAFRRKRNKCNGVGLNFAVVEGDYAIFGIDIDGHNLGSNDLAKELLDIFKDTYCEMSPSGSGYHIIGLMRMSELPEDYKNKYYQKNSSIEVECYIANMTKRYFTFTGNSVNQDERIPVRDVTDNLLMFLDKYMKRESVSKPKKAPKSKDTSILMEKKKANSYGIFTTIGDMLDLARSAKNGSKFISLYDYGDMSDYNDDESRADLALCCMLAFYLEGDAYKIDTAFRSSALYRPKWDRKDYKDRTIQRAIEICDGDFFRSNN